MNKTFKANDAFIDHLLANKFVRRHVESPKKYLVKEEGGIVQVRVNIHKYKSGDITFLDKKGNTLKTQEEFSKSEVDYYISGGI